MIKQMRISVIILVSFCSGLIAEPPSLIPRPLSMQSHEGSFRITATTTVFAAGGAEGEAQKLIDALAPAIDLKMSNARPSDDALILTLDDALRAELGAEGYNLDVTPKRIDIRAAEPAGLFYGIQTLRQLLPPEIFKSEEVENIDWTVPCCDIKDKPRFEWRGLMIDCSRTFWSKEFIKRYIDLLSTYKMNVLHMHLVDDQGWRLEIKKYPELTTKGAYFPEQWNEPPERQGFYTQNDIKEIVQYAADHNITVVPEIEMPGHCIAMLNALPELSCTGKPHAIHPFRKGPNIHPDIMCAGNEETFETLENVLTEVFELFPSEYIHVGGDEAPKTRWKGCAKCQTRIKDEDLKDEHELQSYFIKRVEQFINRNDRKLIGWTEILEGGLAPNAAVMDWRGGSKHAAQTGHYAVMTPSRYCYFDYSYGSINSPRVYSWEPIPKGLTRDQEKFILGVQANFWSHIDRTEPALDRQLFPRLCALSEVAWTPEELRRWEDYKTRYAKNIRRLRFLGINYFKETMLFPLVGGWDRPVVEQYTLKEWDISQHIDGAGEYEVLFQHFIGNCELGIEWASIGVNGREISRDAHRGIASFSPKDNRYILDIGNLPDNAIITLKASIRSEGGGITHGYAYLIKQLPPEILPDPTGYWKEPVAGQYTVHEWDISKNIEGAGEYRVLFQYTHGTCRLGIEMASIEVNGKEISRDTHRGEAGNYHEDNSYMLRIDDLPADATITLKASMRSEGGTDSNGSVYIVKNGSSDNSMGSSKPL